MLERSTRWQRALAACSGLALALCGCLDLDELRDRAEDGDGGAMAKHARSKDGAVASGCDALNARAIRLWKLGLGQSDYVILKNTAACPIELSGLRLMFDDHDELAPGIDCSIQLPAYRLDAGTEVKVNEVPLEGEIGALDNKLSECPHGLPFTPVRGGAVYLCDGECDEQSVIDFVAFQGEDLGPPEELFGQDFDFPLIGVTKATEDSARFRRSGNDGVPPTFFGSDWVIERRYVHADFESSVEAEVEGKLQAWVEEDGQTATFSTSDAVADISSVGTASLSLVHRGGDGRSAGLALELPTTDRQSPGNISYFSRIDTAPATGGFVELQSGNVTALETSIASTGIGSRSHGGRRTEVLVAADTWFQVELRNIDWDAQRFDLYIDRVQVGSGLDFIGSALTAERLSLFSVTSGTTAFWDEIELWRDE